MWNNADHFIAAQIIGSVALIIGVMAFQIKNQKSMFVASEVSNCFWVIHYIVLGAYTGAFVLAVAVIRTSIVLFLKPQYKIPALLMALGLNFCFCFITPEEHLYKYLPFCGSVVFSFALYFNEEFTLSRLITVGACCFWLLYGIIVTSFPEMVESSFIILSVLLGIWRHRDKVLSAHK